MRINQWCATIISWNSKVWSSQMWSSPRIRFISERTIPQIITSQQQKHN